jgi:hypothetical protein
MSFECVVIAPPTPTVMEAGLFVHALTKRLNAPTCSRIRFKNASAVRALGIAHVKPGISLGERMKCPCQNFKCVCHFGHIRFGVAGSDISTLVACILLCNCATERALHL